MRSAPKGDIFSAQLASRYSTPPRDADPTRDGPRHPEEEDAGRYSGAKGPAIGNRKNALRCGYNGCCD